MKEADEGIKGAPAACAISHLKAYKNTPETVHKSRVEYPDGMPGHENQGAGQTLCDHSLTCGKSGDFFEGWRGGGGVDPWV
jgi:hypothetical protein